MMSLNNSLSITAYLVLLLISLSNLSAVYLSIYDIYWAGNDQRKMEKISELQEMTLSLHTGKEAGEYAEEGAKAYTGIGQMYSSYLGKDSKDRGEENDERS